MKTALIVLASALVLIGLLGFHLFRPLRARPKPAEFECYDLGQGACVPLEVPPHAFGIGLSYAGHIQETASDFDPDVSLPVFVKQPSATTRDAARVHLPTTDELIQTVDAFEPGVGERLRADFPNIEPLLDYEVEMGVVLLEDIDPSSLHDPSFAPRLGFFIANDLSARSIAILGEGQADRYGYWGVSKSFPGFMPIADRAWVPAEAKPDGIPCIDIATTVNGEVRQQQSTANLIYTPRRRNNSRREDQVSDVADLQVGSPPLVRVGEIVLDDRRLAVGNHDEVRIERARLVGPTVWRRQPSIQGRKVG